MRKSPIASLLAASLFVTPLIGCDKGPGDKVLNQQQKSTTDSNGNTTTTDQKTIQHPDGTVTTEKQTNTQQTGH